MPHQNVELCTLVRGLHKSSHQYYNLFRKDEVKRPLRT